MSGIGQESVVRVEVCSAATVRRLAGMLDLEAEPIIAQGLLPRGWHFPFIGADSRRSALRSDGFPGLGVTIPVSNLPRLLLVGRTVRYHAEIPIGQSIRRTSTITNFLQKDGAAGPTATITIDHRLELTVDKTPVIHETQTYVMMQAGRYKPSRMTSPEIESARSKTVTPDSTLLFQYSALTFNSHKIHIDRLYAREVEGYPDCVVNGGLTTLLMTEFARTALQSRPREINVRYMAPLFCDCAITLNATREAKSLRLSAHGDTGRLAASMDIVPE